MKNLTTPILEIEFTQGEPSRKALLPYSGFGDYRLLRSCTGHTARVGLRRAVEELESMEQYLNAGVARLITIDDSAIAALRCRAR